MIFVFIKAGNQFKLPMILMFILINMSFYFILFYPIIYSNSEISSKMTLEVLQNYSLLNTEVIIQTQDPTAHFYFLNTSCQKCRFVSDLQTNIESLAPGGYTVIVSYGRDIAVPKGFEILHTVSRHIDSEYFSYRPNSPFSQIDFTLYYIILKKNV